MRSIASIQEAFDVIKRRLDSGEDMKGPLGHYYQALAWALGHGDGIGFTSDLNFMLEHNDADEVPGVADHMLRIFNDQSEDVKVVVIQLLEQVNKAKQKHPNWPKEDTVYAAAIVAEEAGELIRASLRQRAGEVSEHISRQELMTEALHTGATAIRFLLNE